MKKQFFHYGTGEIYDDLMQTVSDSSEVGRLKLSGGLWLCDYKGKDKIDVIDITLLTDSNSCSKIREKPKAPGVLVTLKDNANIFYLDNEDNFKYLVEKYPSDSRKNFFSFEKLMKDFDGIYMNAEAGKSSKIPEYKALCKDLKINTLNLFNTNPIDYYQYADIDYSISEISSLITYNVYIDENKKYVQQDEKKYTDLLEIMLPEINEQVEELLQFKENIYIQIKDLFDEIYKLTNNNIFNCEGKEENAIIARITNFYSLLEINHPNLIDEFAERGTKLEELIYQKMKRFGYGKVSSAGTFAYASPNVLASLVAKDLINTTYSSYAQKNNINPEDFEKYISRMKYEIEERKSR